MDHPSPTYNVLLKRGEFIDYARGGRVVPYKIYYPDGLADKVPLIIWSHGFGGNRDGAAFLSRYLAGHGYILVHLTHIGTDSSLWEGKPGHPWDILREIKIQRGASIDRFQDVPFVLDALRAWADENPDIGQYMDFDNIGMSGHSFGAMTTQVMAGMKFPNEQHDLIQIREPRFKAGILYSPVPIAHLTDAPHGDVYGGIDMPLMHMTGTQDESPLESFGYEHRLLIHDYMRHPEKYLVIKQGGDHMVYNGTRGKLEENPLREKHEDIIQTASLAFWNAYLKDDRAAKAWLESESGLKAYLSQAQA